MASSADLLGQLTKIEGEIEKETKRQNEYEALLVEAGSTQGAVGEVDGLIAEAAANVKEGYPQEGIDLDSVDIGSISNNISTIISKTNEELDKIATTIAKLNADYQSIYAAYKAALQAGN